MKRRTSSAVAFVDFRPERTDRRVGMGLDVAVFLVGELDEHHCIIPLAQVGESPGPLFVQICHYNYYRLSREREFGQKKCR